MARNAVAIVFFLVALGAVAASPRTLIVLDPGHSPAKMGAIGARGEGEYAYNDRLAADLMRRLTQRGFDVRLTRTPQAEIDLAERAQLANRSGAAVFVALHHDSANPKYLTETTVQGRKAYVVTGELRKKYQLGFSLFVSPKNPRYDDSLRLAEAIGRELTAIGRPISTHHTEKIENEGRLFLDEKRGVYRYDDLVVLKRAVMPAVLVEAAVIPDPKEEAAASDPAERGRWADAIARGIEAYFGVP